MDTNELRKQEAGVILKQLGGNKFIAMVGACDFVYDGKAKYANATMRIKAGRKVTHLKVQLDSTDTYVMTFYRIRGSKMTVVQEVKGVYNDMLQEVFTEVTGLATSLGTMRI